MPLKLLTIFLISISIFFVGCDQKSKFGKKKNNTLNIPLSGEIPTLDPANSYDTISASIVYQCYEQLYEYHYLKRPYTLKPLLAEGMPKIENNGTKYTFKIKKNIQYHDHPAFKGKTRFLIAQDFITQIKRLAFLPTKSSGWWIFDGKIKGINKFRKDAGSDFKKFKTLNISGMYTPNDHTLVIELTQPYPQMLFSLAMSFSSPMPIEVIDAGKNNLNDTIVGTGPFKLEKWTRLSGLKLKKFKNYHHQVYPSHGDRLANSDGMLKDAGKKIPFLDEIQYHIIKESHTRWLNLRKGNIDLIKIPKDNYTSSVDASGKLFGDLAKDGFKLHVFPTLTYWWLSFNMRDPLLGKNKNLRLAIAHAINFDKYINDFTNNTGLRANSIYPPGIPGYNPSSTLPYKFDLELAKKYLIKAGFPDGKDMPTLSYDVRGTSATNRQQAEFIKKELANIGINLKIILNTFPRFLDKSRSGKLQFWQDGWAMDYPDAENILQLLITKSHSPGPNSTYYSNPKIDKLFDKLKLLKEGKEKWELMQEMEEIINSDIPWVMQYYARNYIIYNDRLKNYRNSDLVYNYMKYIRLK